MKFAIKPKDRLRTSTSASVLGKKLSRIAVESARPKTVPQAIKSVPKKTSGSPKAGQSSFKMPPLRELERKYKAFADHEQIYLSALEAYVYLTHILCDNLETREAGASSGIQVSSVKEVEPLKRNIGDRHNATFNYMKPSGNYIETRVRLNDIKLPLGFSGDPLRRMANEKFAKVIKSYFPEFNMPKNYTWVEEEGFSNKIARPQGEDVSAFMSLEKFVSVHPNYNPAAKDWDGDQYMTLPKGFIEKGFGGIVFLDLKLQFSKAVIQNTYSLDKNSPNGTLYSERTNQVTVPITVDLVFRWPTTFAYYVTCCTKPADFVPFMFFQYLTWHKFSYISKATRGGGRSIKAPDRVNHLGNIIELIESEKQAGRSVKPRTNAEGFVLIGAAEPSMTGSIVYIPKGENRVAEYLSLIKNAYNAETNTLEVKGSALAGVGLLTDWHNEKFSFMNETGITTTTSNISGILTIDLAGSIPLDDITISKWLVKELSEQPKFVENFASLLDKFVEAGLAADAYFAPEYLASIDGLQRFSRTNYANAKLLMQMLATSQFGITWAHLGGAKKLMPSKAEADVLTTSENDYYKMINAICDTIRKCAEDMLSKWDQLSAVTNYQNRITNLRFLLVLITKYGANPEHDRIIEKAAEMEARNKPPVGKELEDVSRIKMPNLTGVKTFMPHQVETLNATASSPENAMIDVSMGGGKSLLSITEAMQLVFDKKIKRPLFIVPGNLVRNTINEVIKFSGGAINPFAVTLQTCRRMNIVLNPDDPSQRPNYEVLEKLIKSAPPNTIFVCNYRFLIADSEEIIYANSMIRRHYAAEFMRDIGFDGVFVDESHFAKNLTSQQTQATAIVISAAKIKRELSGTMVSNTLTDLVGQGAMMNPAIFRTSGEFNSKYGLEVSGNNVTAWMPDAAKRISEDMKPYAMRITHKRQRWAFMLPKMNEQFHPVNFTPKQKEFYNQLLDEALQEISSKNPKLLQKLRSGDEADAAAIEQGLATYFQAVEQFVYAPDSNAVFANLEDVNDEDLVSPKVAKVVEILDMHFNGSKQADAVKKADGTYDFNVPTLKANPHKVIIFSHRKATSEHMMKHLPEKYRKIAVRYVAGDFQAIDAFQKNEKIRILVADEKSINTGQNFQLASRMIRLETLWSPGEQDQAIARIWRPAFGVGADRAEIYMDWIFTNHSLEVTKIGRLISKIVEKIKYDRQEDAAFVKQNFDFNRHGQLLTEGQRNNILRFLPAARQQIPVHDMLDSLRVIKMNTDNMKQFNNASSLAEYFATYTLVNLWEDVEFARQKEFGKQELVKIPETAYVEIPGSKRLNYLPRVPGVDPDVFDPKGKMGYKPISVIDMEASMNSDSDADEENERYIEINAVQKGELVDTEFGFGNVTKILQNDIWVFVKGVGEVKVPKATAWVITNPAAKKAVLEQLKAAGKRGLPRLPGSILDGTQKPLKITRTPTEDDEPTTKKPIPDPKVIKRPPAIKDPVAERKKKIEEEKEVKVAVRPKTERKYGVKDVEVEDDDNEIEIYAEMVDGQVALTCFAEDSDSDDLVSNFDFRLLPDYTAVKIIGPQTFDKVVNLMTTKFRVNADIMETINRYRPYLAKKALGQISPTDFRDAQRFVAVDTHRMLKPDVLRPFPMVWGKSLYFCFITDKTPALRKFVAALKRGSIPNLKMTEQSALHLKLYPGPIKAINELKQIKRTVSVSNYEETLEYLRSLKGTVKK